MMKPLFLETSILVAQTVKIHALKDITIDSVKGRWRYASTYAILEYYRAVVRKIDRVQEFVNSSRSVADALSLIELRSGSSFNPRMPAMYRTLLIKAIKEVEDGFDTWYSNMEPDYQKARAEAVSDILDGIKCEWRQRLGEHVDSWVNETGCKRVEELLILRPDRGDRLQLKCSRKNIECNLIDLLQKHRSKLEALRQYIISLPKSRPKSEKGVPPQPWETTELKDMAGAINRFLKDEKSAGNYSTGCRRFADLLHALEALEINEIYSLNYKEFRSLCRSLNLPFLFQPHDASAPYPLP